MYNNIPTRVLTGEVRLSYVNLVEPRTNNNDPNGTPKYSVTLLIPKSDVAEVKQFTPLFDFDGDFVDAIDVIPAASTESGIDVNGTFYTLQGMKVSGHVKTP